MVTYVLFIYGTFEDHDDVEFFCLNVLGSSKSIDSLKYVIDNEKNFIVFFDSPEEQGRLSDELSDLLNNENILFYFMFGKNDILLSHIPETISNLIFKPARDSFRIEITKMPQDGQIGNLELDDVLEKIEKFGVESLTSEEKKFLDNFAK